MIAAARPGVTGNSEVVIENREAVATKTAEIAASVTTDSNARPKEKQPVRRNNGDKAARKARREKRRLEKAAQLLLQAEAGDSLIPALGGGQPTLAVASSTTTVQAEQEEHIGFVFTGEAPVVYGVDARANTVDDMRTADRITIRSDNDFKAQEVVDAVRAARMPTAHRPILQNVRRDPLAVAPRWRGPAQYGQPERGIDWGKTRLINFTQYHQEVQHSVEEHVVNAPAVVETGLTDWITSAILPNVPWDGPVTGTLGGAGRGLRIFKYVLRMVFVRRDDGIVQYDGVSIEGAYVHDTEDKQDAEIRREYMAHEITKDVATDPETGLPAKRVDPDTNSFLNIFTDLGGVHLDDGRGARTGIKTYVDTNQPRALGESVAFPEEKGQPLIKVHLPKENLMGIDMPNYDIGLHEIGFNLGGDIEKISGTMKVSKLR